MKRALSLIICSFVSVSLFAQSYNADNVQLANYLTRMYESSPFEGVRVVEDYDKAYLISVLSLDTNAYPSSSTLYRVASVKAMSQASTYFNGSQISSETVIHISEKSSGVSDTEVMETIKENSIGYVKQLQQLTNFKDVQTGRTVFIFSTPIAQRYKSGKQ